MPVKKVSYQGGKDLLDFYIDNSQTGDEIHRLRAKNMIKTLELLEQLFKDFTIYAVTSHLSLVLSPYDDDNCKVKIWNLGPEDWYTVGFELPKDKAPWKNAWVEGKMVSFNELEQYILIAMNESQAWSKSNEFNTLYQQKSIL
jgi:hypothetical protein